MSLSREFLYELHKHFTGDIRTDAANRILYSTDASLYQIEPLGVAIPKTQEDLHAAVELSAKYQIPVLPRGAGTSLAGQAIGEALILDCSRWLDRVLEINPEGHFAVVEPGVVLSSLNAVAARHGLTFGPDPASAERATMGGVIANNATGAHSLLYGMSADHLISADVIMADGTQAVLGERSTLDNSLVSGLYSSALDIRERYVDAIVQSWPRTWRNSAGYRLNYLLPWSPSRPSLWTGEAYPANLKPGALNLATLLAGSEGTLAVIRRMQVNLVQKPKYTILAVLSYQSIADACDDVPRLLTHRPSAIELIPRLLIQLARSVPEFARQMGWVVGDPSALLVVEFSGDQPSVLNEAARKVGDILTIAESSEEQARVWNIRKAGLGILDSRPQTARPVAFIEDCAIPVDKLGEFVREVEKILSAHGTYGGIYAHASAGCLHIRPVLDVKTGEGVRSMRSIAKATLALTLRLGGSMSSEHGDGIARGEWLQKTYGDDVVRAMRMLKRAADPHNLLNPGKLFDAPAMDTQLRTGESYRAQSWMSVLPFRHEQGLIGAIEHCNGQGVCRKTTGIMCPSFQATREEMYSTRGRANLLRAFIANPSSIEDHKSEVEKAVVEALDLCLACKGCKAECPSGVDMAKLKYEFENQYYQAHRRPWRDYVFGYFHVTAKLASALAPLSNAAMNIPVFKDLIAQILGITKHRPFPKFVSSKTKQSVSESQRHGEKIIFLSDPFARYIEPETEQAALEVLSMCGYDVRVLPVLGAGASLLSKGFLEAAKRHAGQVLDALNQMDPTRAALIVGIEPPEVYTLKNDYPDLRPDRAEEIAARSTRTWLLDEFLLRSPQFANLRVGDLGQRNDRKPEKLPALEFHPHCHQRAEGSAADGLPSGTTATVELLRACGYEVELIDSGCCGMAGTFGYEAEHYDLSMQIGELKLFPHIRQSKTLVPALAPGTSAGIVNRKSEITSTGAACRMQIQQGTGLEVKHPILLVRDRCAGKSAGNL